MKNPDDAIERVLTGLRETPAPQGMERRILEAVQERSAQRRGWMLVIPWMLAEARPWAIAATGVVVVALAASLAVHIRHEAAHEMAVLATHQPPVSEPGRGTQVREMKGDLTAPRKVLATLPRGKAGVAQPEAISDEDALAISEMNAPSRPAPPMPLTHQERLLAEVVHHGEPEELANLRPDVRARQMEIAQAEFHDFFEPPSLDPTHVRDNE